MESAQKFIIDTLLKCNVNKKNAKSVAQALLAGERFGQAGHGLSRLPSYAKQSLTGVVNGKAKPEFKYKTKSVIEINAKNGFAYPALDIVCEKLPNMAKQNGIALAVVNHSHHCGVAGVVAERLAEKKIISLFFANTPAAMAAYGGKKAIFGTNPIAFGLPRNNKPPLIIDLSLSKIARGKIVVAKQRGEKLPKGIALDKNGKPTTSPTKALEGTLLPIENAKGSALALMVELLAGGLTGSNYASEANSFFTGEGKPPNVGQLIIGICPKIVGNKNVLVRFEKLLQTIESETGARLPGSTRLQKRKIKISNELKTEIRNILCQTNL